MSQDVEDVRVEITGDTTGVNNAMRSAADAVRNATADVRASAANFASSVNTMRQTANQAAQSFLTVEQALEAETQAARRAIQPIDEVEKVTKKSHLSFSTLSKELVTVVRNMLGVEPVVGQVGNVLGTMALGAPLMIGILAGLAALAYAWHQVSKDAKDAEEAQKKARDILEGVRDKHRNPVLGNLPGAITGETEHLQQLQAELAEWQRKKEEGGGIFDTPRKIAENIARLNNEITDSRNLIQHGQAEERDLNKKHEDEVARDTEEAANKRLAKLKEQLRKEEEARASAAKNAAAKAKAFNDVLDGTRKVGEEAGKRIDERAKKDAANITSLNKAIADADELGKKARAEYAAEWKKVFMDVKGSLGEAIDYASTKAGFLREVWRSVWYDMVRASANFAANEVATWAAMELAKSGITKKSVTDRVATETWGAIKTIAIKTWEAIKWIALHAAKAAAAAWSALAGIPVIGPALGVAAAVATFAGVMALARGLGGGGGAPGGAGAAASAGAGTANAQRTAGANHVTINAVDAKSFHDMAMNNRATFTKVISKVVKEGGLTPKKLGVV